MTAYCVHARDDDPRHTHRVEAAGFADAAIAFAERWLAAGSAGDTVSILVEELETGEQHCLIVDLAAGQAAPCG